MLESLFPLQIIASLIFFYLLSPFLSIVPYYDPFLFGESVGYLIILCDLFAFILNFLYFPKSIIQFQYSPPYPPCYFKWSSFFRICLFLLFNFYFILFFYNPQIVYLLIFTEKNIKYFYHFFLFSLKLFQSFSVQSCLNFILI